MISVKKSRSHTQRRLYYQKNMIRIREQQRMGRIRKRARLAVLPKPGKPPKMGQEKISASSEQINRMARIVAGKRRASEDITARWARGEWAGWPGCGI